MSLCRLSQPPAAHHDDLALNYIAAVRQDGKDGRRVQQPVNHVDDPVGRHDVSAGETDALLAQQDLPLERKKRRASDTHGNLLHRNCEEPIAQLQCLRQRW